MKLIARTAAFVALSATAIALGVSSAQALTLDNGSLKLKIDDGNGAINSVLFGGSEFYRQGTFVSDFGFQNGADTSTFATNTAYGSAGVPVTVTGGSSSASVDGTFTGGGAKISFSRVYSLVPGLNVIRTITTFVNNGADTTFGAFDTFDPDQGIDKGNGFGTSNDVLKLVTDEGLAKVGQATESGGLSVVIGSLNPATTVASGNPFQINSGFDLNSFFASPFDGNGSFDDQGTHIGIQKFLTAGSSFSFAYDQAFGSSSSGAQAAFISAHSGVPIPTPALLPGLIGLGMGVLRKRKAEATGEGEA